MVSAMSPLGATRSSLEEMLDSIRRREERPRDVPPALPVRPVSKARLPSARRTLPVNFKVGDSGPAKELGSHSGEKEVKKRDQKLVKGDEGGGFESRKMSKGDVELLAESPYAKKGERNGYDEVLGKRRNLGCVDASSLVPESVEESEWADSIDYVLKKKLRVWCQLPNGEWESGKIQSNSGEDAILLLSDGKLVTVPTGNLLPANPDVLEGVDDLIQLSYLNEPSVLYNLQYRYSHDMIYTKAGPVLVAINPFKDVHIYGTEFLKGYREKVLDSPHVYAIADTAFSEMMRDEVNQSVIISGESGAGKTETAKLAMQYLAALGGSNGIEYEILQTNCILEAFGNAKTSRNDNSSRFGKLIEIHFSTTGKICGAKIQTFLLEKSRVVQLAKGERSYHIFYQLCAGAPSYLKDKLNIKIANEYYYLKQSNCLTIDEVDDAQRFHILMEALDIVQLRTEDQENTFSMLSVVLWLGNISFHVIDNENHVEVVINEAVTNAAKLMGCNIHDLILVLSTRRIRAGNDDIVQKLTLSQAVDMRDALAKSIYSSLFDWLVEQINKSLEVGKRLTGRSISILDIYGFESFQKNSFEQFCINYANERLQQHFNRHLFKLEQEEYTQDGIDWTKVDFEDNQECLNLFEKKPLGLLSLLDEESTFPKATDLTFANKLKHHLSNNPCFKGERGGAFSVCHYAGEVLYHTSGFLEKNRDPVPSDSIHLFSSCSCQLLQLFASNMLNPSRNPVSPLRRLGSTDSQKQSVGTKFKGQLFKLMQQLENSTPHFIRCIKPNSKQLPRLYEKNLALQQLRCCGVLEVVRISRSGYPTRMTHQKFAGRYGFLLLDNVLPQDPLGISVAILQQFNVHPDMYQVGYTKLFFRTGQIAALEDARNRMLQAILIVQKCFRGYQTRRRFLELQSRITTIQTIIRGKNARKEYLLMLKRQSAIILIQKHFKQQNARKTFNGRQHAVIQLQSVIRSWLVRKHFHILQNLEKQKMESKAQKKPDVSIKDLKGAKSENDQVHYSALADLQKRVLKAEAALGQKEQENAILHQNLKQYEIRWSEYEMKMKSMEEMWQKQMTSLQVSLIAAKKGLMGDNVASKLKKPDTSPVPHYYDSDDTTSVDSYTPEGRTPAKLINHTSDGAAGRECNSGHTAISHLVKEFNLRKQIFNDDANFIVNVKSAQSDTIINPEDELRKLKVRFEGWKKEYKGRLRETKATLQRLGITEDKTRKKWWEKRSTRGM